MTDTVITAKTNTDQHPAQDQRQGCLDIKLHRRGDGDQNKTDQENFLPAKGVGNPAKKQATEKQPNQRRSSDQALPESIQLHLWADQGQRNTDHPQDVAISKVCTERQASDFQVKPTDGQVVDVYWLSRHGVLHIVVLDGVTAATPIPSGVRAWAGWGFCSGGCVHNPPISRYLISR